MNSSGFEIRINRALDEVRPYLKADGGDVRFLRFNNDSGVLEVGWLGTCARCPLSVLTLRAGIERALMHELPEVKRVEAINL